MKNTSGNIGLVPAAYVKLASRQERSQAHLQPQPKTQSEEVRHIIKIYSIRTSVCYRAVTQWFVVYSIKQDSLNQD